MRNNNQMTLSFLSRSANEGFARAAVAAFVSQLDPTLDELADIKTAVSEAVTNAIVHGYGTPDGIVTIECCLSDTVVTITVSDTGRGIPDIPLAIQPMYTHSDDTERSGMGFTVMETFMDTMTVESEPGHGTTVTMTKAINQQKSN